MRPALATLASLLVTMPAAADQAFPAKLAGHAVLPALSFFDPPADAPADLAVSGKFTATDRRRLVTFPFVTIEGVDVVDDRHLVVGNDNNLPYSSGRALGRQDDNELILVEAAEFLEAR